MNERRERKIKLGEGEGNGIHFMAEKGTSEILLLMCLKYDKVHSNLFQSYKLT